MVLRRRRISPDPGYLGGRGWELLSRKIRRAIEDDGFLFVLVIGERGLGKSSLGLNIASWVYGDPRLVIKSLAFTVDDYETIVEKYRELRARDGRVKMILWDDVGVHFSSYRWFSPHQRQKLIDFIENFQSVREEVAFVLATVVEAEMLAPRLRQSVNLIIDVKGRGLGEIYRYNRSLWEKIWRRFDEIRWGPSPSDLYEEYRVLKRLAHKARRRSRLASMEKLATIYAKILEALGEDEMDFATLYGLGVINKDGVVTPFGRLVLDRAGIPESTIQAIAKAGV